MINRYLLIILFFISLALNAEVRDPTRPIEQVSDNNTRTKMDKSEKSEKSEKDELKIQGLFLSKSKRVALINDKFLAVGDVIEQGELVAIFKDRVVMKQEGNMRVFFMINQEVRKNQ